ncbi:glycoside hydrolase family 3 protein [Alkalibacterium olivapovliticus]|uniref:Beta-glucosidase n=1 Tax=Alkalibacterium olivapovliticus TaxID=99907 RepID=A0A2T0VUF2_9LACT|nr:glycoside hydrolase family 3 protein [Alkalibacterium olivapovliticus]PRY75080.1 beta-glucosidase [Alkalibacterium olivapovliticus]
MSSIEEKVTELVDQLTTEEKISLMSTSQSEIKRLGIQEYHVGGEAAHGVVDRSGGKTTSFPQPLGLSQTWNPDLLKEAGTAIGEEARILYHQSGKSSWLTLWAPTIDMERDPRWGRNEEAYGEDPYLTGQLSVGLIKGMQGEKEEAIPLAAAPKHFFGNNNEIGRENTSNSIDPRNREEYYLKAFEPAFTKAKAQSMMTAYNGINGVPAMQTEEIEKTVRGKWEMDGFIVCDGGALSLNVDSYHYYDTYEEALADALKKGIDCFVDDKTLVETAARKALEKALISEDDLTRAIRNSLRVRARLGHFSSDFIYDDVDHTLLAGDKHAALAEKVTEEQIVLLKNDGLLPLSTDDKVLLTGPLADVFLRDWYGGYPPHEITIKKALESTIQADRFSFTPSHDKGYFETVEGDKLIVDQNELKISEHLDDYSTFEIEDCLFESYTFKETDSERYLQLNEESQTFQLNKKEIYDWFVKEKWIRTDDDKWLTWNEKPVGITSDKKVGSVLTSDPLLFVKEWDAIDQAVDKAKSADVCIAVIGNHPLINGSETEDRAGMTIPAQQLKMVQALYEVNPNVVVIIVGSYPFEMEWIKEHIPTILFTTHGSQELGNAIKNVLYHQSVPSGKLSQTWYQDVTKLPAITEYDVMKGK